MEFFYRCSECDRQFDITPDLMLCPDCARRQAAGRPLRGILEVRMGDPRALLEAAGGIAGLAGGTPPWVAFMPVEPEHFPPVPMGSTPLWAPGRLRAELALPRLYIKDDTTLPTGSLKDRASLLVAAFARKHGVAQIVVASTGNAACSMAGIGAAAGLQVTIFIPGSAPRAKLVQSLQYGARVEMIDGSYDDATRASLHYLREHGGMSRNTAYNPLTIEGKKSVALEIFAQLGGMPDAVFVPTGDGVILGGVYKGFEDLVAAGLAPKVPRVYAVQATGSNAICRALRSGDFDPPRRGETVADSISVGTPANGYGALRKLTQHGGRCIEVSDQEILDAQHELARLTGLFAEPAAAASLAGLRAVQGTAVPDAAVRGGGAPYPLEPDSVVVLLVTGNGLKDVDAAARRFPLVARDGNT